MNQCLRGSFEAAAGRGGQSAILERQEDGLVDIALAANRWRVGQLFGRRCDGVSHQGAPGALGFGGRRGGKRPHDAGRCHKRAEILQ